MTATPPTYRTVEAIIGAVTRLAPTANLLRAGCCPFCGDRDRRLIVDTYGDRFRCFSCERYGGPAEAAQLFENLQQTESENWP